ncbi:MAG: zinc ribbon domain-containing protein [Chloroflexi bacterium]|nr:zinc ribbon domain-containing protein [Chloroflexota bacterium]
MPLYEYRCLQCGKTFEKLVRSSWGEQEISCPSCGRREIKRLVSLCGTMGASRESGFSPSSSCAPSGG